MLCRFEPTFEKRSGKYIKATKKPIVQKIREDEIKENLNLRKEHTKSRNKEIEFGDLDCLKI